MAARTKLILAVVVVAAALAGAVGSWKFGRDGAQPSRVEVGTAKYLNSEEATAV